MEMIDMKLSLILGLILLLLVAACTTAVNDSVPSDTTTPRQPVIKEQEVDQEPERFIPLQEREIQTLSDGTKHIVDPNEIQGGGPPKDGIPSIDNPKYVTVAEADEWIQDNELVLALEYNGVKRVYPLQILVWHEIVNDEIGGDSVLITYCPLCGSGIAYKPVIEGESVEFGTSGKLWNSNLVMYDRKTDTYWSQIDGVAILGPLTGIQLEPVSIDTVAWRDWKAVHPDSEVLSQDTGYFRSYGTDPYGNYYENSNVFFPVSNQDNSVHPKTVVFGVEIDGNVLAEN